MSIEKNYKIVCQVFSRVLDEEIIFDKVQEFNVVKSPFNKTANLTYITIEHDEIYLLSLDNDVRVNSLPEVQISIYLNGEQFQTSTYYMIGSLEENQKESSSLESGKKVFTYILVNPVIYWLSNNHSFVQVLSGRAHDALNTYEEYLISNFGDIFDTNRYVLDSDINDFSYEMILSRADNDLMVPYEMLNKYKAANSFGYYYFDDFNVGTRESGFFNRFFGKYPKPISLNQMSFDSFSLLPKIDLYSKDYSDSRHHLEILDSAASMNMDFQVSPDTAIVHLPSGQNSIAIPSNLTPIPGLTITGNTEKYISENRILRSYKTNITGADGEPQSHIILYSPDNTSNAMDRFNGTKLMINGKLRSYMTIRIQETLHDMIQLDRRYNINDRTHFDYVPTIIHYRFTVNKSRETNNIMVCEIKAGLVEFVEP